MFHAIMSATLQYIQEACNVTLNIGIRIFQRIAYACLSCQIHYNIRPKFAEKIIYVFFVCQIQLYKSVIRTSPTYYRNKFLYIVLLYSSVFKPRIFKILIVIVVDIIQSCYIILIILYQSLNEMIAYESGRSGN